MVSRNVSLGVPASLVALVLASCSLTSLEGLTGGAPLPSSSGAPDGGTSDGGTSDGQVTDGGESKDGGDSAAAPANLLVNGAFENSSPRCGEPWSAYAGQLANDSTAHSGMASCRVCGNGGSYTIDSGYDQSASIAVGEKVRAQAWVRRVPGSTKPLTLTLTIAVYNAAGKEIDPGKESPPVIGLDAWTPLDFEYVVAKSGLLNLYVMNKGAVSGDCFLIDDVSTWRVH